MGSSSTLQCKVKRPQTCGAPEVVEGTGAGLALYSTNPDRRPRALRVVPPAPPFPASTRTYRPRPSLLEPPRPPLVLGDDTTWDKRLLRARKPLDPREMARLLRRKGGELRPGIRRQRRRIKSEGRMSTGVSRARRRSACAPLSVRSIFGFPGGGTTHSPNLSKRVPRPDPPTRVGFFGARVYGMYSGSPEPVAPGSAAISILSTPHGAPSPHPWPDGGGTRPSGPSRLTARRPARSTDGRRIVRGAGDLAADAGTSGPVVVDIRA